MKVAAVQYAPEFRQVRRNLARLTNLITKAASDGAKLIVCPELCTTGYSFMSVKDADPLAEVLTNESESVRLMRSLATRFNVAIAWGIMEKDYGSGQLHNSQVLITPTGHFWTYRKANFFSNDYLWATPGSSSPPIGEFMGKRIGLLICADIRDKSDKIDEFYEPGDADIVAFSSNFGKGGFPSGKWVQFAKENKVYFVASNRYGVEENNDFGAGGVCVIDPMGKIHCDGLIWSQDCIVYGEAL